MLSERLLTSRAVLMFVSALKQHEIIRISRVVCKKYIISEVNTCSIIRSYFKGKSQANRRYPIIFNCPNLSPYTPDLDSVTVMFLVKGLFCSIDR